jgi:leader peptidase (prepilin peptidase)/N-methyltransferase
METPATLVAVVAGVIGLAVGSFLNVVVYRLPRGESLLHPPSHCPACGTVLGPAENIPLVSWLALRARCRHCHAPISARYPAMEAITCATWAILGALVGAHPVLPVTLMASAIVLAAAAIDLDGSAVGWSLAAASLVTAVGLVPVALVANTPGRLWWALVGAIAGALWWLGNRGRKGAETRSGSCGAVLAGVGSVTGWFGPGAAAASLIWVALAMAVRFLWIRRSRDAKGWGDGWWWVAGGALVVMVTGVAFSR